MSLIGARFRNRRIHRSVDCWRRCLQKEARSRLHAIADARLDIEEALTETLDRSAEGAAARGVVTSKRSTVLWVSAAILALVTTMALWDQLAPGSSRVWRRAPQPLCPPISLLDSLQ